MECHQCINFGCPGVCNYCANLSCKPTRLIKSFYSVDRKNDRKKLKLMLIGQDPTIRKNPELVKTVLMLDEPNKNLRKWLERELLTPIKFKNVEIYATNLVKCQFSTCPADSDEGPIKFLEERFYYCKQYLIEEIKKFSPHIVLTFGEPCHILFSKILNLKYKYFGKRMINDFNGKFYIVSLNDDESVKFRYSPCLHVTTFRTAFFYGDKVKKFKEELEKLIPF